MGKSLEEIKEDLRKQYLSLETAKFPYLIQNMNANLLNDRLTRAGFALPTGDEDLKLRIRDAEGVKEVH